MAFNFAQFWEYTNQRIRYDENIEYLENFSALSLNDLKQYPPQQCALPETPTLRPTLSHQLERRDLLRRYSSPAKLRLSKTKQRDYMESLIKYARKKIKKLTEKRQYEDEEEWETESSYDSAEWETDSDFDDIKKQSIQDIDRDTIDLSKTTPPQNQKKEAPQPPPSISTLSQIEQQQKIIARSPPIKQSTPLLLQPPYTETTKLKGPKILSLPILNKRVSSTGKRLRRKPVDPKKDIRWKGDEAKRLKVCISALMQMRFHDQLAYSGKHCYTFFYFMFYALFCCYVLF